MHKDLAKTNSEYCENTIALKKDIEHSFLALGERLLKVRDEERFLPNYETFGDFCKELKMSVSAVSKIINIYHVFIFHYKMSPKLIADAGGWSNVAEILPAITSKKDAEIWLHKATTLTRNDLRKEVSAVRTGIDEYDCPHDNAFELRICPDCKLREKVFNK